MGGILSYFLGHPGDDLVDPRTGLTGKHKRLVTESWAHLRTDTVATGCAIMIPFFRKYPEYQEFFHGFKDVPIQELPENKRFQAHCISITSGLSAIIDSLGEFGLLEANLLILGERHEKRGQTKTHFENLKGVVVEALRTALASKFTPEVEDAWGNVLTVAYSVIFKAFDK